MHLVLHQVGVWLLHNSRVGLVCWELVRSTLNWLLHTRASVHNRAELATHGRVWSQSRRVVLKRCLEVVGVALRVLRHHIRRKGIAVLSRIDVRVHTIVSCWEGAEVKVDVLLRLLLSAKVVESLICIHVEEVPAAVAGHIGSAETIALRLALFLLSNLHHLTVEILHLGVNGVHLIVEFKLHISSEFKRQLHKGDIAHVDYTSHHLLDTLVGSLEVKFGGLKLSLVAHHLLTRGTSQIFPVNSATFRSFLFLKFDQFMAVMVKVDSVLLPLARCLFKRLNLCVDLENHTFKSNFDLLVFALQTLVGFQGISDF